MRYVSLLALGALLPLAACVEPTGLPGATAPATAPDGAPLSALPDSALASAEFPQAGDGPMRPQIRPGSDVISPGEGVPTAAPVAAEPIPADTGAAPVQAAAGSLGTTVASLGDPTEPGLWLRTPLVSARQPGQLRNPESGATANVTLIPIDGPASAGSRISLGAMQALGYSLTDLPEIDVLPG
ncbi:MAG: hypothetical protein ACU0CO_14695 [Shimia sp.]